MYMKNKGFSLIEIMVVIAIIGILLAIALPAYDKQMLKSRRADAKTTLLALSQLQETFNMNYGNSYASSLLDAAASGGLDCDNKGLCKQVGGNAVTPDGHYTLAVTDLQGGSTDFISGFILTATIASGKAQDDDWEKSQCKEFSINSRGQKTSKPTGSCW